MKLSILAPLVAAILATPTACAPTPPGHPGGSPAPGNPGAGGGVARSVELACNMYDHSGSSVNLGIIAQGDFSVVVGRVNTPWPKGPQRVTTPFKAIINFSAGSTGAYAQVHCSSGGLLPNWKFECTTKVDGHLVDRDLELGGSRGITTLVDVVCEYLGP
jgi:hypothetical protein